MMRVLGGVLPAALCLLAVLAACRVNAEEDAFNTNRELLETRGIAVGEPNPSAPGGCPECNNGGEDQWPSKDGWPHGGWGWPKPKPEPRAIPLPHPIPDPKPGPKPRPYPIGRKMLGSDFVSADKFGGGNGWDDGGYGWRPRPIPVDPPVRGNPGWGWPPKRPPVKGPIHDPIITIPDCRKGPC